MPTEQYTRATGGWQCSVLGAQGCGGCLTSGGCTCTHTCAARLLIDANVRRTTLATGCAHSARDCWRFHSPRSRYLAAALTTRRLYLLLYYYILHSLGISSSRMFLSISQFVTLYFSNGISTAASSALYLVCFSIALE